jgi:hypothetical protein
MQFLEMTSAINAENIRARSQVRGIQVEDGGKIVVICRHIYTQGHWTPLASGHT